MRSSSPSQSPSSSVSGSFGSLVWTLTSSPSSRPSPSVSGFSGSVPGFAYQAILLSSSDAESTSGSPSPFRSTANTEVGKLAAVVITRRGPKSALGSSRRFSNQASASSVDEAESMSGSPSPSRSAAKMNWGRLAGAVITCCGPKSALASSSRFSYQASLLSLGEADNTSASASPSKSIAKTKRAPSAADVISCCGPKSALASSSRFSYQAILSSLEEAESTSGSPSPSRSVANTAAAPPAALVITCCGPKSALASPRRFSYQAISLSLRDAESTSGSPSLSRSTANTERAESAAFVITRRGPKSALCSSRRFSYHAIASSLEEAESTSGSPSRSRSAANTDSALEAAAVITRCGPKSALGSSRRFSYQAIL